MFASKELRFVAAPGREVSAVLLRPEKAQQLLVLAHGAGAGMRHPFMESLALALVEKGIATFRYQFPYMEERRKIPDAPAVLTATVARRGASGIGLRPRTCRSLREANPWADA